MCVHCTAYAHYSARNGPVVRDDVTPVPMRKSYIISGHPVVEDDHRGT